MIKRKKDAPNTPKSGIYRAMPIILLALAVFIGVCYITKDDTGMLGYAISGVFLGLFSVGAYAIPPLLAIHALFFSSDIKGKRLASRVIFSVLTVLAISAFAYALTNWSTEVSELPFDPVGFYRDGVSLVGGGFIGGVLAFALMSFLGHIGVIILSVAMFAIYVAYFFSKGSALREIGRIIIYGILTFLAIIERGVKFLFSPFRKKDGRKIKREIAATEELTDDDFFSVDNSVATLEVSSLGILESRSQAAIETNPTLHERVRHDAPSESHIVYEDLTSFDDGDDKIKGGFAQERIFEAEFIDKEPIYARAQDAAADADSADSVFNGRFDPYDLALAERLAAKPSSRATSAAAHGVTETVRDVAPKDAERLMREEEFERRKRELLLEQKRAAEERRHAMEETRKNIELRVHDVETVEPARVETESTRVTIEKFGDGYGSAQNFSSYGGESRTDSFKPFNAYEENEDTGSGLYFEFDEPETLTLERTMITRERRAEPTAAELSESDTPTSEVGTDNYSPREEISPTYSTEPKTAPDTPREHSLFSADFRDADDEDEEEINPAELQPEEDVGEIAEIPPEEQNPFIHEARGMFDIFKPEQSTAPQSAHGAYGESVGDDIDSFSANSDNYRDNAESLVEADAESAVDDDAPPFDVDEEDEPLEFIGSDGRMKKIESVAQQPKRETPKKKAPDFAGYKLPPLDLLALDPEVEDDRTALEIEQNSRTIVETLHEFGTTVTSSGFERGPRITRYKIVPAKGVSVNKVVGKFDDITLALGMEGVRIQAPIPGRSAIGIEVPNKHPKTVRLRELLECEEFVGSSSNTIVCLGKDVGGNPIFGDISKFPHALVAGATGMGKSVCINSMLISLLYKATPRDVRFILIDPKKVEFKIYSGIPHLLVPVVTEAKQAAGALMWACAEMERRYSLIEQISVRNIEAYNERVAKDPSIGEPLSKIVIVIDELNDLMMQVRDPVEQLIMSLVQKARAAGIHLIIGTQRPDVKVITGTIKANIGTRIACKVTSVVDSRTILDMQGAEQLLDKGDMLYKSTNRTDSVRMQGCFVSDDEVEAIMNYLKQFASGEQYDEEVLAEINRGAQKCNKDKRGGMDDDGDEDEGSGLYSDQTFLDAVELAIRSGKISASHLQRKLQIGFQRAGRYIDGMESIGVIDKPNGQKPRDVLLTMDEWHEKLMRMGVDR